MKEIRFDYAVFKDGELLEEREASISVTKKQLREAMDFIYDHPTGEIEDITAFMHDSMLDAAFQDANNEIQDFQDEDANYSYTLQKYIPVDLVNLMPDEVFNLLPEEVQEMYLPELANMDDQSEELEEFPEPTKENSLYLTIKQSFFDEIIAGTKKEEYRELKVTTYKKYLEVNEIGTPFYFTDKFTCEFPEHDLDMLFLWNDGVCPLVPKTNLFYLDLAVGYNKNRDTATVEIEDFSFEPIKNPVTGKPIRFSINEEEQAVLDENGNMCYWQIVFHLGDVVKLNKK